LEGKGKKGIFYRREKGFEGNKGKRGRGRKKGGGKEIPPENSTA